MPSERISPATSDWGARRSEERRVGEEGRYRWAPYHLKKKKPGIDAHLRAQNYRSKKRSQLFRHVRPLVFNRDAVSGGRPWDAERPYTVHCSECRRSQKRS